jgi:hypothetical protein
VTVTMPRYLRPLTTQSPSLSRCTPAYAPPRISAIRIGRSFLSSTPAQRLALTPRRLDQYTPKRIPNAVWPYLYSPRNNMANLDSYFQQVDTLQDSFIERLREAVAIPSISSEDHRRPDVVKARLAPLHELDAAG